MKNSTWRSSLGALNPIHEEQVEAWFAGAIPSLRNDNIGVDVMRVPERVGRSGRQHRMAIILGVGALAMTLVVVAAAQFAIAPNSSSSPVVDAAAGPTSVGTGDIAHGASTMPDVTTTLELGSAPQSVVPPVGSGDTESSVGTACQAPADVDVVAKISRANSLAASAIPDHGLTYSSVGGTWAPDRCQVLVMIYGVSDLEKDQVEALLGEQLGPGFAVIATSAIISPLGK
jgi:hypothetical protein